MNLSKYDIEENGYDIQFYFLFNTMRKLGIRTFKQAYSFLNNIVDSSVRINGIRASVLKEELQELTDIVNSKY